MSIEQLLIIAFAAIMVVGVTFFTLKGLHLTFRNDELFGKIFKLVTASLIFTYLFINKPFCQNRFEGFVVQRYDSSENHYDDQVIVLNTATGELYSHWAKKEGT